jgi:hypothetical protein
MNKKEELKNRMKGGMDGLIRSTLPAEGERSAPSGKTAQKEVHCNFVMAEGLHRKMKLIATQRGESLKVVVQEAIEGYLEKGKSEWNDNFTTY